MRLDNAQHWKQAWWVHDYARGDNGTGNYDLLDLWQYPIEAEGEEDFATFLALHDTRALAAESSILVRGLFALRIALGRIFGWESKGQGDAFREIYRDHREQVARIDNATVSALMHLGWVRLENGRYTAQMAVYVRPKGGLGRVYMAVIAPFRHFLVYPALMRAGKRLWDKHQAGGKPA